MLKRYRVVNYTLGLLVVAALFAFGLRAQASPARIECGRGDVSVKITAPQSNATLSGLLQIEGSAQVPDFYSYRLEVTRAGRDAYGPIGQEVRQMTVNGQLGVWDSASVPDGGYTIRLRAFDNARQYCESTVTFNVNNSLATNTPVPTEAATETPSATAPPTALPTIVVAQATDLPLPGTIITGTRTPTATGSVTTTSGLDFGGLFGSVTQFFGVLGRTCLFGAAVGAGIMLIVGALFFVRRVL